MELRQLLEGSVKRIRIGISDPRDDVPVVSGPAGDAQRRAGRDHVQTALRVEGIPEAEEIMLVRTAPVVQDQQPGGICGGRPLAVGQGAHGWGSTRRSVRAQVREETGRRTSR